MFYAPDFGGYDRSYSIGSSFAIAVGAYFGGAFGMFFGVPVVASFKLFISEAVNRKFREKYPHGSTEFPKDDDAIWDYTDEDFVEDIPDD